MGRITRLSRELRKKSTEAEKLLWQNIRNKKLEGVKFRRQHPIKYEVAHERIYFYVADFYCFEKKLCIELDGGVHLDKRDYDFDRDRVMKEMDITVIRISNEQVLNDLKSVIERIKTTLREINI